MAHDALGTRMKSYEAATRYLLPRRTYTIVRVDGRAFHSLTRGLERPYDVRLMADMDATAAALCSEMSGAVLAFVQSDEISVLLTDFGSHQTEPWFGGVLAKVISLSAAVATATFNARRSDLGRTALFDSRVFTINDPVEVANYFLWRQRDTVKNSIAMSAQAVFSHGELRGLHGGMLQEKLFSEKGINWNDYPAGFKRGRVVTRVTRSEPVTYTDRRTGEATTTQALRSHWEPSEAPHFTANPQEFLAQTIPALPSLQG